MSSSWAHQAASVPSPHMTRIIPGPPQKKRSLGACLSTPIFHFWIHFGSLSLAAFQQQRAVRGKKQAATTVNTLKIIFPSSYGLCCNGTGEIGLCDPIGYEQPIDHERWRWQRRESYQGKSSSSTKSSLLTEAIWKRLLPKTKMRISMGSIRNQDSNMRQFNLKNKVQKQHIRILVTWLSLVSTPLVAFLKPPTPFPSRPPPTSSAHHNSRLLLGALSTILSTVYATAVSPPPCFLTSG